VTVVPCTTSGTVAVESAVSTAIVVHPRTQTLEWGRQDGDPEVACPKTATEMSVGGVEERRQRREGERGDVGGRREGRGGGGAEVYGTGGEGKQAGKQERCTGRIDELLQRVRDVQAELAELRAMVGEGGGGCERGGLGRLERLLGLDLGMVEEIVGMGLRGGGGGGGGLGDVLDGSPLVRKRNTVNMLQEVYVRLHRALFRAKLLPIGGRDSWGNFRVRELQDAAPGGPLDGNVLPRYSILRFLDEVLPSLLDAGICLEWATDYSSGPLARKCRETWYLRHPDECQGRSGIDTSQRLVCARLEELRSVLPPTWFADTIICTQVFEHVQEPQRAIRQLAAALKPQGHLIFSVPFLEKYHRAPVDMRRYTNESTHELLNGDAGMCVRLLVRAGDALLTTGYLLGMGSQDFTAEELAASDVSARGVSTEDSGGGEGGRGDGTSGGDTSPTLYYGVMALAQAPPC
jgi:hypothetical protein